MRNLSSNGIIRQKYYFIFFAADSPNTNFSIVTAQGFTKVSPIKLGLVKRLLTQLHRMPQQGLCLAVENIL